MSVIRRALAPLLTAVLVAGSAAACSEGSDGADPAGSTGTVMVTDDTDTAVEPSALVLRGDGVGVADLGAEPDEAIAAVTSELGEPTADSGWESSGARGTCPGEGTRAVEWNHLVLLFTDGETPYGSGEHLFAWRVDGAPPAVGTANGFGYRAVRADAEELYPGSVEAIPAQDPFPGLLQIDADGGTITAFLDDHDVITNLEAGAPCGE